MRRAATLVALLILSALVPAVASANAPVLCAVSGSVAAEDGPGATLPLRMGTENGSAGTTTAEDGSFALLAPCGSGWLSIGSSPGGSLGAEEFVLEGDVTIAEGAVFALQLPPVVDLTVTVTDPDGVPVAGASVRQADDPTVSADPAEVIEGAALFAVTMQLEDRMTGPDGTTQFRTFPISDMHLTVTPPAGSGLVESTVTVPAAEDGTGTVVLDRAGPPTSVRGHVYNHGGVGLPDTLVGLRVPGTPRVQTTTDSLGGFGVEVSSGQATIDLQRGDQSGPGNFYALGIKVAVAEGTDLSVTLPRMQQHTVRVLAADGSPVAGASVMAADGEPFSTPPRVLIPGTAGVPVSSYVTASTDGEGRATFPMYTQPELRGLVAQVTTAGGDVLSKRVPTLDGRVDSEVTVTLPPPPTDNAVSGVVRDSSGNPLYGLDVYLGGGHDVTDFDGRYELVADGGEQGIGIGQGGGQFDPGVRREGVPESFNLGASTYVAGDTVLDIQLPRAHTVGVTLTDPATSQPAAGVSVGTVDTEPFRVTGVDLGSGLVATGDVYVTGPPSDETGRTSFLTWDVAAIPHVVLDGQAGPVDLRTNIKRLEVLADKELELVLGTTQDPALYTPPTPATDAMAVSEGATARTARRAETAQVSWRRSTGSGGLPVTGYRVSATPGGSTVTVPASATKARLTGLKQAVDYTFSVRAVNAIGRAPSAQSRLDRRPPTARMIAPKRAQVGTARVTLTWTGSDDASGVASYSVRAKRGTGAWEQLIGATSRTSKAVKVDRGTQTCVQVRAKDKAGRVGRWSDSRCFRRVT